MPEMLSGYELNYAVSDHVLGRCPHPGMYVKRVRFGAYQCAKCAEEFDPSGLCPDYSVSWGAMGSVVDAMRVRGYFFIVDEMIDPSGGRYYKVSFRRAQGEPVVTARGRELPLAVARAALATVQSAFVKDGSNGGVACPDTEC